MSNYGGTASFKIKMPEEEVAFRVLSISGGGFLGLYSAAVLAAIEEESNQPLHRHFDLIAGTSIGGIIALGIAANTPAAQIVEAFKKNGSKIFSKKAAPRGPIAQKLALGKNALKAKYGAGNLQQVITDLVGADTRIGDLKQRTIIPAVNLTKGSPQVFKTPHHETFVRDWKLPIVDVALATSAAPTFFPIHKIGGEMFADGGLYANSPDEIALHEAEHFLGQQREDIHILSIGTTTTKFSFSGAVNTNLGWIGWMGGQQLPNVMIGAQQMNADFVLRHKLGDRYLRLDREQSVEQSKLLALDVATPQVIDTLIGLAEASVREHLPSNILKGFLAHTAPEQDFFRGKEND